MSFSITTCRSEKTDDGQQVEDTLYRVPRHYFEQESEVLRDMFNKPQATDTIQDSCDEGRLCVFADIKGKDFEQLLRVLFPM